MKTITGPHQKRINDALKFMRGAKWNRPPKDLTRRLSTTAVEIKIIEKYQKDAKQEFFEARRKGSSWARTALPKERSK